MKQTLRIFVEIWDRLRIIGKQILEGLDAKILKGLEEIEPPHPNGKNADEYQIGKDCYMEKEVAYGDDRCNAGMSDVEFSLPKLWYERGNCFCECVLDASPATLT
jgi:hypothetical protein